MRGLECRREAPILSRNSKGVGGALGEIGLRASGFPLNPLNFQGFSLLIRSEKNATFYSFGNLMHVPFVRPSSWRNLNMQDHNVASIEFANVSATQRTNRVLRNTYMLLALSMVPTVVGAWFGVASGLSQTMLASPMISLVVFMVGAFGFMFAIERNKDSGLGVGLLLAFTFFMGVMLSRLVGLVLGMKNGASLVGLSFGGTALIFAAMATLGTVIKRDLSGFGKFLFVGAMIVFIASLVMVFFPVPAFTMTLLVLMLAIFSGFMLYNINQVVRGGETNYIVATMQIYMDIYNVFSALLSILGITNRE
jgi:modulator of FtsH protease